MPTTHDSYGAVVGVGAATTGTSNRFRAFSSSGNVIGSGSTITGTSHRYRSFVSSGNVVAGSAHTTGTSRRFRAHASSGAVVGVGSSITGTSKRMTVPVITSALTASVCIKTAYSYQITATQVPTSYNATGLPTGLSINTTTGLISGTPAAAGTANVTISATNAAGTGTATLVITQYAASGGGQYIIWRFKAISTTGLAGLSGDYGVGGTPAPFVSGQSGSAAFLILLGGGDD